MKALLFDTPTGPDALYIGEVPDPGIGPNEVLVAVVAISLNRADLLQLHGRYPGYGAQGTILGLDLAGTVMEVGSEVADLKVGDNVCALMNGGAYAQLAAVDAALCLKLPSNLSFTKAAALPEVFLVAYQALNWMGDLKPGETVLIHAGASGVGTAMIQLAKHMGAKVLVTASKQKHEQLYELGADYCIDYKTEEFDVEVLRLTDEKGVELIIDFIGVPYASKNLTALAVDGKQIMLSMMGGRYTDQYDASPIVLKRLTLIGSTLRPRSLEYKQQLVADFSEWIWPLFANRTLKPVVDSIFDWEDAASAFKYMASNANVGKIIITIGE